MRNERRRSRRVPAALPVRWRRGKATVAARAADISLDGMFVETTEAVPPGQVMNLAVELPTGKIEFLGVSRRSGAHGVGLIIFSMDPKDRARWNRHCGVH